MKIHRSWATRVEIKDMSGDDRAQALDDFVAELNRAWQAAGPPSYGELPRLSEKVKKSARIPGLRVVVIAKSTTNEILTGRRHHLPKWPWLASFVLVLQQAAAEGGLDPRRVGTLDEWKARHERADTELRNAEAIVCGPGTQIRASHSRIGDIEAGQAGTAQHEVVEERSFCGDDEEARRTGLLILAQQASALSWLHEYRDVVPSWFETYVILEPAARLIHSFETQFVPGLLQTEQYAAAVIGLGHTEASAAQIRRRVELRMRRKQLLHRPNAPKLWTIIDAAALRAWCISPATMRAQIKHLIEVSEMPNVTVQIMPSLSGGRPSADAPITLLRFPGLEFPDVIYLEQLDHATYPNKPDDIDRYKKVLSRLGINAPPPNRTRAILHDLLAETETRRK